MVTFKVSFVNVLQTVLQENGKVVFANKTTVIENCEMLQTSKLNDTFKYYCKNWMLWTVLIISGNFWLKPRHEIY